jgi:hypothetical protein
VGTVVAVVGSGVVVVVVVVVGVVVVSVVVDTGSVVGAAVVVQFSSSFGSIHSTTPLHGIAHLSLGNVHSIISGAAHIGVVVRTGVVVSSSMLSHCP